MREVILKDGTRATWLSTNGVYRLTSDAPTIAMGVTESHWWIVGEGTPYNSKAEAMDAVENRIGATPAKPDKE